MATQPEYDITTLVRNKITARLANSPVKVGDVASDLSMSLRTLQRQLAAKGSSFSRILDDVRKEAALAVQSTSEFRLDELSRRLGYRQQSTLTRAFKRWVGASPSGFYHRQR